MHPLDQGPHLPGETAKKEEMTVKRERAQEERGGNKMRVEEGRDWGIGGLKGAKEMHSARLSVTATLCCIFSLHKQKELFLYTEPKTILRSTRSFSTLLVPFRIPGHCSFLLSIHEQGHNLILSFTVLGCLFYVGGEEKRAVMLTKHIII